MKYKLKFPHGIMFHHFHNLKEYKASQGSISSKDLEKIIKIIGRKNIIDAEKFIELYEEKKLKKNHVCLTFDDGLKCQYKIALPVLKKFKIKAFWFIYTSILTNKFNYLEIYREFRHRYFRSVDDFYNQFFLEVEKKKIYYNFNKLKKYIKIMKNKFPFYTRNDLKFRYLRDFILKSKYGQIMQYMMKKYEFNYKSISKKIFLNKSDIFRLSKGRHVIGLHSHNHPTNINKKIHNFKDEYKINKSILEKIIKKNVLSMSHPCGNYNLQILNSLNKLKIKIGFNSNLSKNNIINKHQKLQLPREDHSNLISKYS
tara:strand:+ start:49844 stop:50782 length:939 start_codon:yes stop_codon:yes gene_type:complete